MSIVLPDAPDWQPGVVLSFSPESKWGFLQPDHTDDPEEKVHFHLKGMQEANASFLTPKYGDRVQYLCPRRGKRRTKSYAWRFSKNPVCAGQVRMLCVARNFGFIGESSYFQPGTGRVIHWSDSVPIFSDEEEDILPAEGDELLYIMKRATPVCNRVAVWGYRRRPELV